MSYSIMGNLNVFLLLCVEHAAGVGQGTQFYPQAPRPSGTV